MTLLSAVPFTTITFPTSFKILSVATGSTPPAVESERHTLCPRTIVPTVKTDAGPVV